MPTMVISAVNLVEGGTLKVLQDCLRTIKAVLPDWRVIALVYNEGVINVDGVEAICFPSAKTSWLRRVYTEYVTFNRLSKKLNADIWWSLHDMTPRVRAGSQFVYCHNPVPFYSFSIKELLIEPKLIPFSILYPLFYKINIKSNRAVIVQQDWLRDQFKERYGVREVVVAHPVEHQPSVGVIGTDRISTFVYPSLSRVFKNFDLIGEAAQLLENEPDWSGRIVLTIAPDETRLSRDLFRRFGNVRGLHFIGRQNRDAMTILAQNGEGTFPVARTGSRARPAEARLHRLLERQLAQAAAASPDGKPDLARLVALVSETYREHDHTRRMAERSGAPGKAPAS